MLVRLNLEDVLWRETPDASDAESVRSIVESSGFFSADEMEVAVELVKERLLKGISSGYHFFFAEREGDVAGYVCFGPIPCTTESFDIYWIAVRNDLRGSGLGRRIMEKAEKKIREMGGSRIYVETSSQEKYNPTHSFYRRCGYRQEAILKDFYSPGDHKVIYIKRI